MKETKDMKEKTEKKVIIKEVVRMMKECEDMELIHLVYVLLLKNR